MRHFKAPWWKKRITREQIIAALDLYSTPESDMIDLVNTHNEGKKEDSECLRTSTQRHGTQRQ